MTGKLTYRDLAERYWKSPFGKNFRRGGYRWGYFKDSIHGFVRSFYELPFQEPMPADKQAVADKLEGIMRRIQATNAAQTRKRKREQEISQMRRRGVNKIARGG